MTQEGEYYDSNGQLMHDLVLREKKPASKCYDWHSGKIKVVEWFSVDEKPPEEGQEVLGYNRHKRREIYTYEPSKEPHFPFRQFGGWYARDFLSHWCALPEKPE